MARFPQDEAKLVAFLRQYRPLPPPVRGNLEKQLMQAIASQPLPRQQLRGNTYLFWTLATAFAGLLLLVWGSDRWFSPSPFPPVTVSSQELEVFFADSWQGAIGESRSPETDWLLLADLELNNSHSMAKNSQSRR